MPTRIDGRCLWLRQAIASGEEDAPPLQGDAKADVCIVGGGLAGLRTALDLKRRQPALDVAIVEADICGGGASGRNSGMVLPQWAKFAALQQLGGNEEALRLCRASAAVVGELEDFSRTHGIEFRRDGWIWGATCASQVGAWDGVIDALAQAGAHPFLPVSRDEITALTGTTSFHAGIQTACTATLHPGKLVRALRRVAVAAGVRVYENSPMIRLERRAPPLVHTAAGSVSAGRVVLTLNAWSTRLPELRPAILVIASDDAVTAPISERLDCIATARAPS